jgi:MFS family permease
MTDVREGRRGRRTRNPYAEIFRIPGTWQFSAAGVIGRVQMSMYGLGTVLLVAGATGRYGVAGAVAAAGSLGSACCAPQVAKLADRHGQRVVLRPLVTAFAVTVAALIAAVELHAPDWVLFIPAVLSGASMPSLGSMVRARWNNLLADSPHLHTAFSFESVADELVFVLGPAVVTVLSTEVFPAAGLLVATAACVAGVLWFVAQRATEPPVTGTPPVRAADEARRRGMAAPALIVLVPVYVFLGAMFASIDLSTVGFAQHFGHKALAGLILGTYALGSATGGLWYGSRSWRSPIERRFAITLALTVTGVATFWVQPSLLTLVPVIYLSGMTIAPTLIAGFSLVQAQARPGRGTEALTWLSTGIAVGVATGSSVVGFVIDAHGPRAGYVFAAGCGAACLAICLAGLRRLRER